MDLTPVLSGVAPCGKTTGQPQPTRALPGAAGPAMQSGNAAAAAQSSEAAEERARQFAAQVTAKPVDPALAEKERLASLAKAISGFALGESISVAQAEDLCARISALTPEQMPAVAGQLPLNANEKTAQAARDKLAGLLTLVADGAIGQGSAPRDLRSFVGERYDEINARSTSGYWHGDLLSLLLKRVLSLLDPQSPICGLVSSELGRAYSEPTPHNNGKMWDEAILSDALTDLYRRWLQNYSVFRPAQIHPSLSGPEISLSLADIGTVNPELAAQLRGRFERPEGDMGALRRTEIAGMDAELLLQLVAIANRVGPSKRERAQQILAAQLPALNHQTVTFMPALRSGAVTACSEKRCAALRDACAVLPAQHPVRLLAQSELSMSGEWFLDRDKRLDDVVGTALHLLG